MTAENLTVRPFLRYKIMRNNKKNIKKTVDNKFGCSYNKQMGGLYSQQSVTKRGYLSHINTKQTSFRAGSFSSAGTSKNKPFFIAGNSIINFLSVAGSLILRYLIIVGKRVFKLLSFAAFSIFKLLTIAAVKFYKLLSFAAGKAYKLLSATAVKVYRRLSPEAKKLLKQILLFLIKVISVVGNVLYKILNIVRFNPIVHRVILAACTLVIVTSAGYLIYFAIASPELPPENLFSTIIDISKTSGMNDHSRSRVSLSSDDDWAELTTFNDTEFETGAGSQGQDRTRDFEYPVRPGETLSEIAYAYGIPYDFLAWYNDISNADRIRVGTIIIIPSIENMEGRQSQYQQQRTTRQRQPAPAPARVARSIEITYESFKSGTSRSGITAHFSIVNPPSNLKSYEWDMGDGRRSFRQDPRYEYSDPKTYVVRLTAQDDAGIIYRSNPLYIDIPYPASTSEHSTTVFVTLSSPDEYFVVRNGTITKVARFANIEDALDLSESDQYLTKVRFKRSGYYGVTVLEETGREQYYSIFVSPIPTMHVDYATNNFNWYRTQFNTGTPSNCGPASASMAICWGTGQYFPVSSVRNAIGWQGDGGTSFDDLISVIRDQGVPARIQALRTVQNIRDVIDNGGIAIILFHTDGVGTTTGDPASNLFGKYYNDSVGHYVVIKGYSMDGEYFVIHDPIPSDWGANSFRYGDELSMMGRNRYFKSAEVLSSLRRSEMIVVTNQN